MRNLLTIAVVALIAGVVGGFVSGLVGSNQPGQLGGTTFDGWIVNEGGGDFDSRFEGDTNENLLFVDASTDRVGIGTAAPAALLDVSGEANLQTLVFGGSTLATTTSDAGTFTAAQFCDNSVITATPDVGSVTLTTDTAANLIADCIPTAGDSKLLLFENATTSAAITTTIAAGSAVILTEPSGGDVVITGNEWAEVLYTNLDGTNVYMRVMSIQDAD